jgi:TolB-like protein/tetratricopeptide (TPR) repeat protein
MSWISFGPFALNVQTCELRKGDIPAKIQQQPARILALLAQSPGSLVSREQIREAVWGATNVSFEQSLNFCIRQIRIALDDDADNPTYVETIPRLGYRFLSPVQRSDQQVSLAEPRPKIRICVLPIRDSGLPSEDYFALGLTEDLIAALCRLDPNRLRIVAGPRLGAEDVNQPDLRRLQRELKLDYILDGWVRRSEDRVRVCAQLHDLHDQSVLWSEIYNGGAGDLPGLQDGVARRVGQSLALELLPSPMRGSQKYGSSPLAYDSYLKGRYFWHKMTPQGMRNALRSFTEALERDPNCAPAYAGLADCYAQMGSIRLAMIRPLEALAKARPLLERATEMDDTLAEVHCTLGLLKSWYEVDWKGADLAFQQALRLEPQNLTALLWRSLLLSGTGRHAESIESTQRALESDPASPLVNTYVALAYVNGGQFDLALRQFSQAIELDPHYYRPYMFQGLALIRMHRHVDALGSFEKALMLNPENLEALAYIGVAKAIAGDREGALDALEKVRATQDHYEPALLIACIYAALGDSTEMFDSLRIAYEQRCAPLYLVTPTSTQFFGRYRLDPRYVSFLKLLGLPQS